MAQSLLHHVGLDRSVTWPKIFEDLDELEEDEKAGEDELDLLERRRIIHNNIRCMFVQWDKDADDFIVDYMKELQARKSLECGRNTHDIKGILICLFATTVIMFPSAMATIGITISKFAASAIEGLGMGLASSSLISLIRMIYLCIRKYRFKPIPFPDWFIIYLKARDKYPLLTQPITSSSHPHLFKFLHPPPSYVNFKGMPEETLEEYMVKACARR